MSHCASSYVLSFIIPNAVLAPFFIALLIRVYVGSQLVFVQQISWLLLSASFGAIVYGSLFCHTPEKQSAQTFNFAMLSICLAVKDACFSVGYWIFAFKYYKIQKVMPIMQSGKEVPQNIIVCVQRTNTVFILINLTAPLLEGVAFFLSDQYNNKFQASLNVYVSSKFAICLLQVVSAGFLGYGIYKISK